MAPSRTFVGSDLERDCWAESNMTQIRCLVHVGIQWVFMSIRETTGIQNHQDFVSFKFLPPWHATKPRSHQKCQQHKETLTKKGDRVNQSDCLWRQANLLTFGGFTRIFWKIIPEWKAGLGRAMLAARYMSPVTSKIEIVKEQNCPGSQFTKIKLCDAENFWWLIQ